MIRPYHKGDREKVLDLCKEFWETCCEQYGEFNRDHTSDRLDKCLNMGACLVTENVDGFILLVENTNLCNDRKIAAEVAWYVRPSCRGGAGIKLLKTAFKYCERKGISTMSIMFMESSMPESIVKIYDKLGCKLTETTYIKRF